MDSLESFLHMGGYAAYVWSAYAITAIVLLLNVILSRREHKQRLRQVKLHHTARSAGSTGAGGTESPIDSPTSNRGEHP